MKNETKLVNKVKRLLRRLGCPRWLHHYGPKTYEFLHHIAALLIRAFCKLSYRRVKQLLDLVGMKCPSKSALHYTAKKLDSGFWQRILDATSGYPYIAAIDSTGLSRTHPSYYYLKRIDGGMPRIPVKVSAAIDTRTKRFCAAKIRVLPAHDLKDAGYLIQVSNPRIAVLDKGYVSEKLYEHAHNQGVLLMIPAKKNARRGFFRRRMHAKFNLRTYHRREIVESCFSAMKRKYGSSVSSKTARTIRTEVYCRLACHNLFGRLLGLLGQSPRAVL